MEITFDLRLLGLTLAVVGLALVLCSAALAVQTRRVRSDFHRTIDDLIQAVDEVDESLQSFDQTRVQAAGDLSRLADSLAEVAQRAGNVSILGMRPFEGYAESLSEAGESLRGLANDLGSLEVPDLEDARAAALSARSSVNSLSILLYILAAVFALAGAGMVVAGLALRSAIP